MIGCDSRFSCDAMQAIKAMECLDCEKVKAVIAEQKEKMRLIESRMKDLIRAYKSVTTERDALLANSAPLVLPINDCEEQQKRLSALEASVAEMSAICGKYESQRIRDKELIDKMSAKCEQLSIELEKRIIHDNRALEMSDESQTIVKKKFRHRAVQTESVEVIAETSECVPTNETQHFNANIDCETQTDFYDDFDANSFRNRKSELAIVLPTQRDCVDCESSGGSLSASPLSIVDNYSIFASQSRDATKSDVMLSNPMSNGVSLFYVNELARKEIDLAEAKLQSREHECALRELQWKYNIDKYKLQSRINDLERLHSQLCLRQPMSQLNVTYIRNVLLKLLNNKDKHQRQFMINALLTALDANDTKIK